MFDRWSNLWGALERTFRRQRRGSRRRLAHDFEPVSRLRPVLTEINRDLESQFLEIGNHLEKLSTFSSRVVDTGEQLLRLATGQAEGTISCDAPLTCFSRRSKSSMTASAGRRRWSISSASIRK